MLTHWLNFFIATKRIFECRCFCKWKFLYIVNSADGSFCCNYVMDTLYSNCAVDDVCCNYVSFEALLQLCRRYLLSEPCWWIIHVTVSVAIIQLQVSAALMQVTGFALNMWVKIFIVFMQVEASLAIMQVVLSAVHNYFYCKMQITVSVIAM